MILKKFAVFVICILVIGVLFFYKKKSIFDLLDEVESDYVIVDKYYIYGNHLNIEGSIDIDSDDISLVFKGLDNEISFDIDYNDGKFTTSKYINEGIYLDDIQTGEYFVFIKVGTDDVKYYSLVNNTDYNNTDYYTVTRNNKNNLININFSNKNHIDYMMVSVSDTKVSNNYYDVVIDPGHGGDDPGASYSYYTEAELNLDYALALKDALEDIGLKVILTRVEDVYTEAYGNNSRTSIPYEVNAKYFISLHLNSTDDKMKYGGIEVYAPTLTNLDFASSLAKNIVLSADTNYSKNESFNVDKGVYIRTFTTNDISQSIDEAKKYGYNPYPITTNTNYYFMIRETGGFMTGAYVDGRNKNNDKNEYYKSNVGAESYLLELGYINYWPDLNNLVDNQEGYIEGIVNAFKNELNL